MQKMIVGSVGILAAGVLVSVLQFTMSNPIAVAFTNISQQQPRHNEMGSIPPFKILREKIVSIAE